MSADAYDLTMRVVALLAAFNESRFIGQSLEHLARQGVGSYLLDNDSTDDTRTIAQKHLGDGLIGIERIPRRGTFSLETQMRRKEELASDLESDWFIHADPDEVRLPPREGVTLKEALTEVDASGYNAVNFDEFTFLPTRQEPNHDHPFFEETMRWYYPYRTDSLNRLNAWKRQAERVDLVKSGGHRVKFPGLRPFPTPFRMRHYLFLSLEHAREMYVGKVFDPDEVARGWHRPRPQLTSNDIRLPDEREMRVYEGDDNLDASSPVRHHLCFTPPEEITAARSG